MAGGAALVGEGGATAWVLIDDGEVSRFGPALAWCAQAGAAGVRVIVDESVPGAAGVIARRATQFSAPPEVWVVDGRGVAPAEPSPASRPDDSGADPGLVALLEAHGVDPVVEHGVLRGEVLGLEVARVIGDKLVVGVGRHDRDARAEMRPGEDPGAALDSAVSAVLRWRRPGVARHAANTLARGRWLRSIVCARPSLVGASEMHPVAPPMPWFDLPEAGAAPCVGADDAGRELVVVCSAGVDMDLVPTAADCRLLYGTSPDVPLALVLPAGDDLPVTRRLAGMLASPAEVVTVSRDWESLAAAP